MSEMFLHLLSPVGAICSNFSIRACSRVSVSPPPQSVPTTQPAVIEWQNNIHSSPPHSQNFWAKSRKQPLRLLSEPPKIGFHIGSPTFAVRSTYDWRVASIPVCDLRHVHYNALTISYEHNFQRKTCKKLQLFKGKVLKRSMMVPSGRDSTQIKFLPWPWCRITAHTSRADGHPKCTLAVKAEFSSSVNDRKVHCTLFPPR